MAPLFGSMKASSLSMDVLFPESYEASKKTIARDFVAFGIAIVIGTVGLALLLNTIA